MQLLNLRGFTEFNTKTKKMSIKFVNGENIFDRMLEIKRENAIYTSNGSHNSSSNISNASGSSLWQFVLYHTSLVSLIDDLKPH